MLRWAITFAIIALMPVPSASSALPNTSASIAKIFALVFLVMFVVALIFGGRVAGPTV